ncbi:hypothetical protein HQ560_05000 [bacterium]|nr:hypothetical protein [bacterium]
MERRGIFSIAVAAIIVAVLLIFLIAFQVRFNETAIVYQFGRPLKPITEPGLCFKLPYPIQTVTKYSMRVRTFETKYSQYITKDEHNILVAVSIGWSITDALQFHRELQGDIRTAQKQLEGLSAGARQAVINSHELGDFINTDPKQFKFAAIESEIETKLREDSATYGVKIAYVDITKFNLPAEVTKDVLDRIRAERTARATDFITKGESAAQDIRTAAEADASAITSKGEAAAIAIRGLGDAKAAEHYEVFAEHPTLANFLKSLQALVKLRDRTTYILTTEHPPYQLLDPDLVIPGREGAAVAPKPTGRN